MPIYMEISVMALLVISIATSLLDLCLGKTGKKIILLGELRDVWHFTVITKNPDKGEGLWDDPLS